MAETDTLGDHRRASLYDHPHSQLQRREDAEERRGDLGPIGRLRVEHRDETNSLRDKHQREAADLEQKFRQQRNANVYISNGARPPAEWLEREASDRKKL